MSGAKGRFDRLRQELQGLDERLKAEGLTPLDVMALPEPLRTAMNALMRKGSMTVSELAAELHIETVEARQLGEMLVEKGLLSLGEQQADGEIVYRVRLGRRRGRSIPLDL
jgi:hypothetical protein